MRRSFDDLKWLKAYNKQKDKGLLQKAKVP